MFYISINEKKKTKNRIFNADRLDVRKTNR